MEQEADYGMNDKLSFEERLDALFDPFDTKGILNEDLFSFTKDIELLWKPMKKLIKGYKQDPSDLYDNAMAGNTLVVKLSSADFQSKICKKAHALKPIAIRVGLTSRGNLYSPHDKIMMISLNRNAIKYLGRYGFEYLKDAAKDYPQLPLEFEEDSIKGTIAHEISHWLRDAIHKDTLLKQVNKQDTSLKKGKPKFTPVEWKYTSYHEIDANIHAIALLKKKYKKQWDSFTFLDVIKFKSSLYHMYKEIVQNATEKEYTAFIKRFFGRLTRENLLGKNMRPIPKDQLT